MIAQEAIDYARSLTYSSKIQYDNTKGLQDLNIAYNRLRNLIINKVNEKFFWDYFTTYSIVWQDEYTLPEQISKVEDLFVNWVRWKNVANKRIAEETGWNVYYIADNSIFLYKTPEKDGIEIKLYWEKKITPLSLTSTIDLPDEVVDFLPKYLIQYIYQRRWMIREKNDAINQWKNIDEPDFIMFLSDRNVNITENIMPDLSYYE